MEYLAVGFSRPRLCRPSIINILALGGLATTYTTGSFVLSFCLPQNNNVGRIVVTQSPTSAVHQRLLGLTPTQNSGPGRDVYNSCPPQ